MITRPYPRILRSASRPVSIAERTWRVTTATRVFVLALAIGLAASSQDPQPVGMTLLALCVLAAIMSAVEFDARAAMPAVPVAEAALAAIVLGLPDASSAPVAVYLLVPPLVAGLRHGTVSTLNAIAAEACVIVGMLVSSQGLSGAPEYLRVTLPWLAVGLGVGLLASWMRSSTRALEDAQGPYGSAHRLLTQLRRVSQQLPTGLDSRTVASFMVDESRSALAGRRAAILVGSSMESAVLLAQSGGLDETLRDDPGVRGALSDGRVHHRELSNPHSGPGYRTAFPARIGDRTAGVVVIDGTASLPRKTLEETQARIDEHSLRLDTALLFDEVRALATDEERTRVAREIHDGIAQEIASLGYLVDDLAAGAESTSTRIAAIDLRRELSRVVSELRLSIFDLRHGVHQDSGLSQTLGNYAREVVDKSGDLRLHLDLEDAPGYLRPDVESELLRVGQEAIANVRKHAHACNLWVRLRVDDGALILSVEDDGEGSPQPRPGHFGLATMHERARKIGAHLTIDPRSGGGTVVVARLSSHTAQLKGPVYVDHRVAG